MVIGKVHKQPLNEYKLQIYISKKIYDALNNYIEKEFPGSNVVSAITRKALEDYLRNKGYLE